MSFRKRVEDEARQRLERTERVLDVLEAAIESELDVDERAALPAGLLDPVKAMERGRQLLEKGLEFAAERVELADADDDQFRMAARNGTKIPEHVIARMRAERQRAEAQIVMNFDESQ